MQSRKTRRGPRLGLRISLIAVAFLVLGIGTLAYLLYDPSPVGHFRTEEGYQAYAASYAAAMKQLPLPTRSMNLKTDFGTVRVYKFGSAQTLTPIVLLPGRSSGVPMWEANLPSLAEERIVYALDALGDAGMSVQTRKIRNSADQARWLEQVLAQLDWPKVHLMGHSFGGWSAANYAVQYPERVASLTLLEPVFVFQGLHWQVYIKSLPASLPFLPTHWRDAMLGDFGGAEEVDPDDPVARMISDATEHYAAKLPLPQRLSHEQLRSLPMPVYVAMAAESSLHDAAAATRVARNSIQSLQIRNWPRATHSLPMEFPKQLNRELLNFVAAHDPTLLQN